MWYILLGDAFQLPNNTTRMPESRILSRVVLDSFCVGGIGALCIPAGFMELSDPLDTQMIPHGTLPIPTFDNPTPCACKLVSARPSKNV